MIRILTLIVTMAFFTWDATAQIETPSMSPGSSTTQDLGLIEVTVEYSRPLMRGRTIFAEDGLVPFGKAWRTGANAATKISFSGDVTVGGEPLSAGDYALLTIPGAETWEVHFYPYESRSWSSYLDADSIAAKLMVKPVKMDMTIEQFTIAVTTQDFENGLIEIMWENTALAIPVHANTNEAVIASIDKVMAGPSKRDYYMAASYMNTTDQNLEKALEYVQIANDSDSPKFWQLRTESEILAKLGKYKEAIATAKQSKEAAMEAGNEDYIKINSDNIEKWMKM